MTTRYVGSGGNDGNSGLTWALRKLTLNGVENTPVAAGDLVHVGPGVYREQLTVDVSGSVGSEIIYVGDVFGRYTDGIGGVVRITGSDDDQTRTRGNCIYASGKDYRKFRGFMLDTVTTECIEGINSDYWTVEDCSFQSEVFSPSLLVSGPSTNWSILRNLFFISKNNHIKFTHSVTVNASHTIQNCLFLFSKSDSVQITRIGDVSVKDCFFLGSSDDLVDVATSPESGHPCTVNNCILIGANSAALEGYALGDLVEDYNTFYGGSTNRTNVAVGAHSVTYPPLLLPPLLEAGASQASGFKLPWFLGMLSKWSQVRAITGSGATSVDLFGVGRPATASKKSWGAVQFQDVEKETGTTRGASAASICLHDASRHQMFVPVTNESTTISVYVNREANYAGTLPQMVIKQPGQSDRTTVDTGSASAWNQLSDTFTPDANTDFVVVELVSNNTAAAGNYDVFFDDLAVT